MKLSDILRSFADKLEQIEPSTTGQTEVEVSNDDCTDQAVMIPPLQQKLELLKKAVGEESFYNDDEVEPTDNSDSELEQLKKSAGITVVGTLASDNDIEF